MGLTENFCCTIDTEKTYDSVDYKYLITLRFLCWKVLIWIETVWKSNTVCNINSAKTKKLF